MVQLLLRSTGSWQERGGMGQARPFNVSDPGMTIEGATKEVLVATLNLMGTLVGHR